MHSSYTIQKRDQDPEAGGADGPKKEYKEVKPKKQTNLGIKVTGKN